VSLRAFIRLDGMEEPDHAARAVTVTLVRSGQEVLLGSFDGGTRCDLGFVEDLLRLDMTVRRLGWSMRLDDVRADVREVLELVGLADALSLDAGREAERREQVGVDEVVDAGDATP